MEPKAPDNSQVKRINFITMLLTHPLQSGLTLQFSKCFSPPASGTNGICILIRSVCTVLNQGVTALFIPESLYESWDLFLLLEPYFLQGQYTVASPWGTGSLCWPDQAMRSCFLPFSGCASVRLQWVWWEAVHTEQVHAGWAGTGWTQEADTELLVQV